MIIAVTMTSSTSVNPFFICYELLIITNIRMFFEFIRTGSLFQNYSFPALNSFPRNHPGLLFQDMRIMYSYFHLSGGNSMYKMTGLSVMRRRYTAARVGSNCPDILRTNCSPDMFPVPSEFLSNVSFCDRHGSASLDHSW